MTKTYQLGIFGFGGMGHHHFKDLRDYPRIKVKGVFDVDPARRADAEENGVAFYASKEALLSDPELDMVLVATSNDAHKELCIDSMRAGKHILCEKPVTLNSKDLEDIIEASENYGKIFTINQNRRADKDFLLFRDCVEKKLIDKPYLIESRVEGSRGIPRGWRTVKELGGGMMLDWGVHLIDQIMYMFDEKVTGVFCKMFHIDYKDVDDSFHLALTFESALTVFIEVSTNSFITHPRWLAFSKNGSLQIDGWDCEGRIVRCLDKENDWEHQIVYTKAGPTKTMAPRSKKSLETIPLSEPLDVKSGLAVVYDQFVAAADGVAELTIKPHQALRVMKVMEAAFLSAETESSVKVDI